MAQVYVTPSWLNDSDLDVYAYRIYGFLADKAALEPLDMSVPDIAAATKMSARKAQMALKDLEKHNLVHRQYRARLTTLYHVLQPTGITYA